MSCERRRRKQEDFEVFEVNCTKNTFPQQVFRQSAPRMQYFQVFQNDARAKGCFGLASQPCMGSVRTNASAEGASKKFSSNLTWIRRKMPPTQAFFAVKRKTSSVLSKPARMALSRTRVFARASQHRKRQITRERRRRERENLGDFTKKLHKSS